MAVAKYEMSDWDRMRLILDKTNRMQGVIASCQGEHHIPAAVQMLAGLLGETCLLHAELREHAAVLQKEIDKLQAQAKAERAAAEAGEKTSQARR